MPTNTHDIESHWKGLFGPARKRLFPSGPRAADLVEGTVVLAHPKRDRDDLCRYATVGVSLAGSPHLEFYICSQWEDDSLANILFAIAHFHQTGESLDEWHTVNLGEAWLDGSQCDRALIMPPYFDGPEVESVPGTDVRCLWVVPITASELDYKKRHGGPALERLLYEAGCPLFDPGRSPVV